DPLAPALVRTPEDGDLHDPGHLDQRRLDLGGIDVDAAGDDQVCAAGVEVDIAVRVDAAEVADREGRSVRGRPPGLRRALRVVPVLEAAPRRDDAPQLVVLVDGDDPTGSRAAHGAGVVVPLAGGAGGELALGGPVELPHDVETEQIVRRATNRVRTRRP